MVRERVRGDELTTKGVYQIPLPGLDLWVIINIKEKRFYQNTGG